MDKRQNRNVYFANSYSQPRSHVHLSLDNWLNIASNLLDNESKGGSRPSHYLCARLRDKYEKHYK